jgi:hypothetical protein
MTPFKKLNKNDQTKVETTRQSIIQLQEAQNLLYSRLIDELGQDSDWMHDYIYNCTTEDAYTLKVRGEIFE